MKEFENYKSTRRLETEHREAIKFETGGRTSASCYSLSDLLYRIVNW